MGILPDTQIVGCACFRERFRCYRLQRKLLVSDPDMHRATCVMKEQLYAISKPHLSMSKMNEQHVYRNWINICRKNAYFDIVMNCDTSLRDTCHKLWQFHEQIATPSQIATITNCYTTLAWCHQATSWTNVGLSVISVKYSDIYLRVLSHKTLIDLRFCSTLRGQLFE